MNTVEEILKTPESEIEAMNDYLMEELVPVSGNCSTVEGEMLRAINRIGYRFLNDGDLLHTGYGIETAAPAYMFLKNDFRLYNFIHPELRSEYMNLMEALSKQKDDDDYESSFLSLMDVIVRQILIGKLNGLTSNTEDIFDYSKAAIDQFGDPYAEEMEDEDEY